MSNFSQNSILFSYIFPNVKYLHKVKFSLKINFPLASILFKIKLKLFSIKKNLISTFTFLQSTFFQIVLNSLEKVHILIFFHSNLDISRTIYYKIENNIKLKKCPIVKIKKKNCLITEIFN